MLPVLDLDHQYVRTVESWNEDLVAQIRRCGRAPGRRLGYRVRTVATDAELRDDSRRVVSVVVMDSNPEDEDRIRERSDLLLRQTLDRLLG
jgi:hypothetical protein